jgi:PAS domain S-box-containing protein
MTLQSNSTSNLAGFKIIDHFNQPAIIVDGQLNLVYQNNQWLKLFYEKPSENLNDLLKPELTKKLKIFISSEFYLKDALVDSEVVLSKSKYSHNYFSLFLYYLPISSKDFFIISFMFSNAETDSNSQGTFSSVNFINDSIEINKLISIELREIFDSVSDIIPLSLTNRNKIKLLLDERKEIIWLKDSSDKLILANDKYFNMVGSKETEIQKLNEDYLFFPYQKEFLKNLMEYCKTVRKPVQVSGIKYSSDLVKNQPLIIYPIADKQGKGYLFFYVLQSSVPKSHNIELTAEELDQIEIPIVKIDREKNILYSNTHFHRLIAESSVSLSNNLKDMFDDTLVARLDALLKSEDVKNSIFVDENFSLTTIDKSDFIINLFNKKSDEIYLLFYPIKQQEELKSVFSQRGKILDYYIQSSPEPIFVFDKDTLKFLEVNQPALNFYGYNRDEFLKLDLTDLYSPEDFQSLMDSIKNYEQNKTTNVFRQKTKSGKDIFVRLTYNFFKYNGLDSFFVVVKDVTESHLLQIENKILSDTLNHTSDILLETDSFGFIKSVNKNVSTQLGYSQRDLIDSTLTSLVMDEQRILVSSKLLNINSNPSESIRLSIRKADGQYVDANVKSIPIVNVNGEVNTFKLILSLEESLTDYNPEVKEIIREVYIEKPVPTSAVQNNQNYLSGEFLSGVFHEILTPLNVIFGFAQEIVESFENPTTEQKEALDIIKQNRIKLLDTMNSVVEYSELVTKSSQLNIKEFRLVDIVEKLEKEAGDIAKTFGIIFSLGKVSTSLVIQSDADKLERVINGLIKIVCRIVQEKKIYLSIYALDKDSCFISISDHYNSTSDFLTNSLNKIFNLNVEPRELGAPRLTVHITKFFMELIKMQFVEKIRINDRVVSGFVLPLKLEAEQSFEQVIKSEEVVTKEFFVPEVSESTSEIVVEEPGQVDIPVENKNDEPQKPTIDLSNLTCLYIEDQIDSQVLFKVQMKELKEIVVAPSFEEALPHLEKRKFDFIVIDINLEGEYNGLDALKLIRKLPGYENVPIFASTAYILPGNKERFIAAGFNDFIDKPIFKERIIQSLSEISMN